MPGLSDLDAMARAERWLTAWDAQGIHRTGTEGDHAGAEWLAHEATALGAPVTIEEFVLDRVDPVSCFLEIGDARIAAVPAFDAPATGPDGIEGRLGDDIAVAELSPRAVYSGEFERLRRAAGHRGLAIVCSGDNPGLGLLNAESFRNPYGTPAIHISSEARDTVLAAAAKHAPTRLIAHSRRTLAIARNVVVTLPGGGDRDTPPLVVMTPRSSWWQSTAERGGGIVCWLESLRALLADPPARPVVFTANSGHELNHLGLDDFIARRPGCEESAIWVHYGANLGAACGGLSLMSASDDLRHLGAAELDLAGRPHNLSPKTSVPSGETRDIHKKGGRYLTLVGTNPWFHLPTDRWPHSIDLPAVASIAAASARLVLHLTRERT